MFLPKLGFNPVKATQSVYEQDFFRHLFSESQFVSLCSGPCYGEPSSSELGHAPTSMTIISQAAPEALPIMAELPKVKLQPALLFSYPHFLLLWLAVGFLCFILVFKVLIFLFSFFVFFDKEISSGWDTKLALYIYKDWCFSALNLILNKPNGLNGFCCIIL